MVPTNQELELSTFLSNFHEINEDSSRHHLTGVVSLGVKSSSSQMESSGAMCHLRGTKPD
jgi:hypothetical protein